MMPKKKAQLVLPPIELWLDSSDIELVSDFDSPSAGVQKIGLRFAGMDIPVGATINDAYLVFRAVSADPGMSNSDATSLTLKGQLIGDAPTFTSTSGNISSRTLTNASTAWAPTAWTTGSDYNSPDIASVVQEIVNQGTWASGNNIAIIITGTGHRASQSYDTDPAVAAQLVVTFTTNSPPQINSDGGGETASINVVENTTAVTTVTATDADLDTLTYSINGGADAALFSINSTTGVLTFITAPDYENPTDTNTDNIYEVTVQTSDGNGGTDVQTISVTVTNINESPTFTTIGSGDGIDVISMGTGWSGGADSVVLDDGKILVLGSAKDVNGNGDIALTRYNADGTLDTSYGTNGIAITSISSGTDVFSTGTTS